VLKNPSRKGRVFYRPEIPVVDDGAMPDEPPGEPVALPITGELDLHTFRPGEVARLLDDYFAECRKRGLRRVRVVHGKGTGTLRETVHARLRLSPHVVGFALGDETSGGWGATLVTLKPAGAIPRL
jgi:dsDNA-specific endonuclease/ATPase MutS2